jgi:hypothetical protein
MKNWKALRPEVCPDFVGPGRLVGQLQAVVLRFWDIPRPEVLTWVGTVGKRRT